MKKKILIINSPKLEGERYLEIILPESVETGEAETTQLTCKNCHYFHTCGEIPHPEKHEDSCFTDFCHEMASSPNKIRGVVDISEYLDAMPAPYSIERCFANDEHMSFALKNLITSNIMVSLKTIVDEGCSSWCEFSKEDYSRCKGENQFCLISKIFANKGSLVKLIEEENNNNKSEIIKDEQDN